MRDIKIHNGNVIITEVKELKPEWHQASFITMDDQFVRIRSTMKEKYDECFICSHKFNMGEDINLVHFKGEKNKVLCFNCYDELISVNKS